MKSKPARCYFPVITPRGLPRSPRQVQDQVQVQVQVQVQLNQAPSKAISYIKRNGSQAGTTGALMIRRHRCNVVKIASGMNTMPNADSVA